MAPREDVKEDANEIVEVFDDFNEFFRLKIVKEKAVCLALVKNGYPIVRSVEVENLSGKTLKGVEVTMDLSAVLDGRPQSLVFDSWTSGQQDLAPAEKKQWAVLSEFSADEGKLGRLEESIDANLVTEVSCQSLGAEPLRTSPKQRVLAFNLWDYRLAHPSSVAAFVLPRDPAVGKIIEHAKDFKEKLSGDRTFSGYQQEDLGDVQAQAEAIYEALCDLGISYVQGAFNDPAGQKIKTPSEVLRDKAGNCIDLAVTYAACLQQVGLHPLIWLVPEHAYGGFVKDSESLENVCVIDKFDQAKQLQDERGLVVPLELTGIDPAQSTDFAEAVGAGRANLFNKGLACILHPHNLHTIAGVTPFAWGSAGEGLDSTSSVSVGESGRRQDQVPEKKRLEIKEPVRLGEMKTLEDSAPGRIQVWKRDLVDLSSSNPLVVAKDGTRSADRVDLLTATPWEVENAIHEQPLSLVPLLSVAELGALIPSGFEYREDLILGAWAQRLFETRKALAVRRTQRDGVEEKPDNLKKRLGRFAASAGRIEQTTGVNSLFLTFGRFIGMSASDRDDKLKINAPVFLVPVHLTKQTHTPGYQVEQDPNHSSHANPFLIEFLLQEYGLEFSTLNQPPGDERGLDLEEAFEVLQAEIMSLGIGGGFTIEDSFDVRPEFINLQLVDLKSFHLWSDIRDNYKSLEKNRVFGHFLHGGGKGLEDLAASDSSTTGIEQDTLLPSRADGPQMRAIRESLDGASFVLEGPPGTGKSQTIVNVISSAIAGGKSVLFVAEKQTALKVIEEDLRALGFGDFILELHDFDARQLKLWKGVIQPKLKAALADEASPAREDEVRQKELEERYGRLVNDLGSYPEALHRANAAGETIWTAANRLATERLGNDGESASGWPLLLDRSVVTEAERFEEASSAIEDLSEMATGSTFEFGSRPLWGLANLDPTNPIGEQAELVRGLDRAISELDAALRQLQATGSATLTAFLEARSPVGDLSPLSVLLDEFAMAEKREFLMELLGDSAAAAKGLETFENEVAAFAKESDRLCGGLGIKFLPVGYPADEWIAQVKALPDGLISFGRKSQLDEILADIQTTLGSEVVLERESVPSLSEDLLSIRAEASKLTKLASKMLGPWMPSDWSPFGPNGIASAQEAVEDVQRILAAAGQIDGQEGGANGELELAGNLEDQDRAILAAVASAWSKLVEALEIDSASFDRWRSGGAWITAWAEDQKYWSSEIRKAAAGSRLPDGLAQWSELLAAVKGLEKLGMAEVASAFFTDPRVSSELRRTFSLAVAQTTIQTMEDDVEFMRFEGSARDRKVADYQTLAGEVEESTRKAFLSRLRERRERGRSASSEKISGQSLTDVINKGSDASLRDLLSVSPGPLLDLIPCFLMSPQSVASLLPADPDLFDLVIFDEASQIRIPESVGAIGRATNCMVVGDSRQMPPSVRIGVVAREGSLAGSSAEDDEEGLSVQLEDPESILEECKLAGLPSVMLEWHYRSKDEALVAFSNGRYYDGRLMTLPAPAPPGHDPGYGVFTKRVEGGEFKSSKVRDEGDKASTNPVEAEAVLRELATLLQGRDALGKDNLPSVGIVTLNNAQRDFLRSLVEDEAYLDGLDGVGKAGREAIVAALERTGDSSLLIQSIQNIQGDEREVILLSLVRSEGQAGGLGKEMSDPKAWRRVNVAITRARRKVVVFHSFDPQNPAHFKSDLRAVQDLKAYVKWAKSIEEGETTAAPGLVDEEPTGIIAEIAASIRRMGDYEVETNFGLSRFTVDIAVRTPDSKRWQLALLLDSEEWALGREFVVDRDRAIELLSSNRGWASQMMIYTPDWISDKQGVLQRIVDEMNMIKKREAHRSEAEGNLSKSPRSADPTLRQPTGTRSADGETGDQERAAAQRTGKASAGEGQEAGRKTPGRQGREGRRGLLGPCHDCKEAGRTQKDGSPNMLRVIRNGNTGKWFVGCSGYNAEHKDDPTLSCRTTFPMPQLNRFEVTPLEEVCSVCGERPRVNVKYRNSDRDPWKLCFNKGCPTMVKDEKGASEGEATEARPPAQPPATDGGSVESVSEATPPTPVQTEATSEENTSPDDHISVTSAGRGAGPRLVDDTPRQPFAVFDPALHEVGSPDDLEIPTGIERKKIIALIAEVAEVEGPVEVNELAVKVTRCFGVEDASEQMLDLVINEIPASRIRNSGGFGDFVWPDHLDPQTWNGFREPGVRFFNSLPPEEVVNASRFVLEERGPLSREDLVDATAHALGATASKEIRVKIGRALETGLVSGRLVTLPDGHYFAGHVSNGAQSETTPPDAPSQGDGSSSPRDAVAGPENGNRRNPSSTEEEMPARETEMEASAETPLVPVSSQKSSLAGGAPTTVPGSSTPGTPAQPYLTFSPTEDSSRRPEMLDQPGPGVLAAIAETLNRVIAIEGPVEIDRVITLVARSFGARRTGSVISELLGEQLRATVPPDRIRNWDGLGGYVWPEHLDPNTWDGFRRCGSEFFTCLPPEELVNASRYVLVGGPHSDEQLVIETSRALGIKRAGRKIQDRILKAVDYGVARGRLTRTAEGTFDLPSD